MDDLISRQAAINALWKALHEYEDKTEKQFQESDELDISDWILHRGFVQNMSDIDRRTILDLPSAQQWIPCSERMPDEDYWTGAHFQYSADVLMTVYNAEDEETIIDYGHTVDGSWYSERADCFVPSLWKVLAWMPLPEPYEVDSNGRT